jgi:hypothetical protein
VGTIKAPLIVHSTFIPGRTDDNGWDHMGIDAPTRGDLCSQSPQCIELPLATFDSIARHSDLWVTVVFLVLPDAGNRPIRLTARSPIFRSDAASTAGLYMIAFYRRIQGHEKYLIIGDAILWLLFHRLFAGALLPSVKYDFRIQTGPSPRNSDTLGESFEWDPHKSQTGPGDLT